MSLSFVIDSWAACASGLDTPEHWRAWADAPWLPQGEPTAPLAAVPPMLRRRFAPLGRLAAQAVFDLPPAPAPREGALTDDVPSVFASRYGETARCLELLKAQAAGEALSPTAFALSVHNALGAMIAIARGDRRNSSAVAAGPLTAAAGVVEATALLEDGAEAVDLVVYDSPLPSPYLEFAHEPAASVAWAWRLRRPRAGERALCLDWLADDGGPADERVAGLSSVLQVLWFSLSDAPVLDQRGDGRRCRWTRETLP